MQYSLVCISEIIGENRLSFLQSFEINWDDFSIDSSAVIALFEELSYRVDRLDLFWSSLNEAAAPFKSAKLA